MQNIIDKIKKAGLVGRGGACFPTATKWEMVKNAAGEKKYIVCNASEGEPGVKKDGYILEHFPEKVIDGMKIAVDFLSLGNKGKKTVDVKGYVYINPEYYKKYGKKLEDIIRKIPPSPLAKGGNPPIPPCEGGQIIEVFKKPESAGYIGGEETSALNAIEGKRIEPRLRPPFPTTNGLWNCPTIINNVETLYNVSLVASGEYKKNRFYTINGDCLWTGVYEFSEDWTIEKILKETNNYPNFDFFTQIGGDGSGEILNSKQLNIQATGAGSITVFSVLKHKPLDLIKKWLDFFISESCGQCTPCREGIYRLLEIVKSPKPDWHLFGELLNNLSETAFCGLGCVVPVPIKSYFENVLANMPGNEIDL
ncbi:hypothetical protein KJ586_00275 [Patescibacteria group bacterium]|nr:hypothetical protein [Patescibacteria group bacterium]